VARYLHYDVFTDKALTGNQLAVFTDPAGLDTGDMARITREMNFSECTFILPAEESGTDVRLRIFGLEGELPFAGHPVIGSTFALAHEGLVKAKQSRVTLGLGLGPTPEGLPIEEVSCGLPFFYVPLTSRAAVDQCALDQRASEATFREAGLTRRGIFIFSTEPGDDEATVYSRMLGMGPEDPATGSASGPLGCYLVRHRLVPPDQAGRIVSRQGVKMGRPSRVHIRIVGTPEKITDVKVGGASVLVGDGRITKI